MIEMLFLFDHIRLRLYGHILLILDCLQGGGGGDYD
jgi:hypothetical protein